MNQTKRSVMPLV